MRKRPFFVIIIFILIVVMILFFWRPWGAKKIKIGFILPLTGDLANVGKGSKFAAELYKEEIGGTLKVGDKKYNLEFIYEDNRTDVDQAISAAIKLIVEDNVLAIVGPQSSRQAIPAGEICEINSTPMISPWSTNPQTTAFRPYIFRGCFLDPFQGPVIAKFATKEFGAKTAAVLYDKESDYPKGLAKYFKTAFEGIHGSGSVVAFETFVTNEKDFNKQLTAIIDSKANILFVPQYYSEVHLIVKQAQAMGWNKPILGGDAWGSSELMNLCGDGCKGQFFSTHYAAAGAKGRTQEFIELFESKYGYEPDDVAALTWDSVRLLLEAIQNSQVLTGDLMTDRDAIKDQMAEITDFEGITGKMSFTPEGDPSKCAVIVRISEGGAFEFYQSVCP